MLIQQAELKRYHLEGKLGEGADSEAFAATDTETGKLVVVKRPHPMLIARSQHGAVERRMARVVALRQRMGDQPPHISRMLAYTEPASHDSYFGDSLIEAYSVVVEERATGIPLVGSAIDGIKRHPIGAPQNLFAVHPILPHPHRGRFSIVRDLLDVVESFQAAGTLLLDLRPQNIYFDPQHSSISVIDIGGVTEEIPPVRGNLPLDLHDFYLELFKWYIPIHAPPADINGYLQPQGMDTVPMFRQNLDSMIREHSQAPEEPWRCAALDILRKVSTRAYTGIADFRKEFEPFLLMLEARYAALSTEHAYSQAWQGAKALLAEPYWRKYQFDPDSLADYDESP